MYAGASTSISRQGGWSNHWRCRTDGGTARRLVVRGPIHHRRRPVIPGGRSATDRVGVSDWSNLRSRDSTGVLRAGVSVPECWRWTPVPRDPHVRRPVPDGDTDDWSSARSTWRPAAVAGCDSSCLGVHRRIRGSALRRVDGLHSVGGRHLTGGMPGHKPHRTEFWFTRIEADVLNTHRHAVFCVAAASRWQVEEMRQAAVSPSGD